MHQFRRLPEKLAQKKKCCRLDLQQEQYCPLLAGTQCASELSNLALKGLADGTVDSMGLEGLRDLSMIATVPLRRMAIETFVRTEGNGVIREPVLRELKHGGQVYFLHNEVETIKNLRAKLEELLPEAIAIAYGQIPERENWARAGMHDLEIRGAGEVLGENQNGNMLEVGFQLYNEMLSEAVRCLKAGIEPYLLSPLNKPYGVLKVDAARRWCGIF